MRGHRVAGALLLAALLLFREDMGFHIFSFAFLTYLWLKISKGDPVLARRCLVLSVAVFLYSLAALYIQKHYFVADNALARIYLGSPPLAHLNVAYLWQSLSAYVTERPAMAILPAVCVIMAICFREPAYLIGAVAVAPWVMLNAIAIAPAARSLSLYYAFPLLLTAVWPLVASTLLARRNRRTQQLAAFALFALLAFCFASGVPRNSMADLRDLAAQIQSGPDRSQTSLFADCFSRRLPQRATRSSHRPRPPRSPACRLRRSSCSMAKLSSRSTVPTRLSPFSPASTVFPTSVCVSCSPTGTPCNSAIHRS